MNLENFELEPLDVELPHFRECLSCLVHTILFQRLIYEPFEVKEMDCEGTPGICYMCLDHEPILTQVDSELGKIALAVQQRPNERFRISVTLFTQRNGEKGERKFGSMSGGGSGSGISAASLSLSTSPMLSPLAWLRTPSTPSSGATTFTFASTTTPRAQTQAGPPQDRLAWEKWSVPVRVFRPSSRPTTSRLQVVSAQQRRSDDMRRHMESILKIAGERHAHLPLQDLTRPERVTGFEVSMESDSDSKGASSFFSLQSLFSLLQDNHPLTVNKTSS